MTALRLRGIAKNYGGRPALSGIDLTLEPGEVLGVVGPNGAGKTTLLGIIAGLVSPSEGEGEVLGRRIARKERPCPFIGTMIEKPAFIEYLSGRRNLRVLASLRGRASLTDIDETLRRVGLDPKDGRPVQNYSQGMRQRLSLAQAIMERPSLYLLDEPTNGLDPEGIVEMRGFIRVMADEGAAVLLASHLLGEVETICDRVAILSAGRCIREFAPRLEAAGELVLLCVSDAGQLERVARLPGVVILDRLDECSVRLTSRQPIPELVRGLVAEAVDVEHVGRVGSSLEEIYLHEVAGDRRGGLG